MSLWVRLTEIKPTDVFELNTTHNLNRMASAAGIYQHIWRPEELGIKKAAQLIEPLTHGYRLLKLTPEAFRVYESPNGWGRYDDLCKFVWSYLQACIDNPNADVHVTR